MKIRVAPATAGMQFVVEAETDQERVLLSCFYQQVQAGRFAIHGWTYTGSVGHTSFNFGTSQEARP